MQKPLLEVMIQTATLCKHLVLYRTQNQPHTNTSDLIFTFFHMIIAQHITLNFTEAEFSGRLNLPLQTILHLVNIRSDLCHFCLIKMIQFALK